MNWFPRTRFWRSNSKLSPTLQAAASEPPLRAELFNVEQLERHARVIATGHQLAAERGADQLLPRLSENERVLNDAYELIASAAARKCQIVPAAEWLLDNFYLIEEQISSTRRLLPRSYSGELPRLSNGPAAMFPRVYGIALELIAHTDGRVDSASLDGFVAAYQSVVPLKLGELWALPLMLRLALIENLRRVAGRIAAGRCDRDSAAEWAERMIRTVEQSPTDLVLVLADMARANPRLSGSFLAELTRHLQAQNLNFTFASSWLEQRLADQGRTTERLVSEDGQAQASDQVSVGNSIGSLRFLAVNDWRTFVAAQSLTERTLSEDPAGIYAGMDFATRDRYRHAVEAIAKRSRCSEYDVAHRAIQLALEGAGKPSQVRTSHVGYFLIDRGRTALERATRMKFTTAAALEKIRRRHPLLIYASLMLLGTGVTTAALLQAGGGILMSAWLVAALAIPALLCATQLSLAAVNWLISITVSPQPLPRMDFREGIPDEHRTLIAIPTILANEDGVGRLIEGLEIRYLANRDANLLFAIVTDFKDAATEFVSGDADLVRLARVGIEQLNGKYLDDHGDRFFLLHRNRRWNPGENVWMGYERKRGKLADLNATLRGQHDRFAEVAGDLSKLSGVRFVITLDTDTLLPRDAARELIEAMAHPLNRPVLDAERRRITDGYGILQPRVGVSLPSARRSWFVRLFGGDPGVDPYTRVVSDLYQDMFGEGSFIGKGIYDIDAFEHLCGNFPENAILSHDLLESCYCRSALLSDVILYEDFPSSYAADAARRHRWMRGDWQIAAWLFPRVRGLAGDSVRNPISGVSWWKICDNLRRSLLPASMLLLLTVAWLAADVRAAAVVTLFVVAIIGIPRLLSVLHDVCSRPTDMPRIAHLRGAVMEMRRPFAEGLVTLLLIPYEAYLGVDALVRTLVRVHWTKTRLLEWQTSSDADQSSHASPFGFVRAMIFAPAISTMLIAWLSIQRPALLMIAGPLLGSWLASPLIAWFLSRPLSPPQNRLSDGQQLFLRHLARKTWRYFETFVTPVDNWLPPDNVHLTVGEVVAPRTSPTNIGMALLSDLAAYDFGYCSATRLLDRTDQTFATLARMERHCGHFFNWYHTRTLEPLLPRYVSTVDSGNLAGDLVVLASGLRLLVDTDVMPRRIIVGLRDTAEILRDEAHARQRASGRSGEPMIDGQLIRSIDRLAEQLQGRAHSMTTVATLLPRVIAETEIVLTGITDQPELEWWTRALLRSSVDHLADLKQFAAWALLPPLPESIRGRGPPEASKKVSATLEAARQDGKTVPTESFRNSFEHAILLDPILAQLDQLNTGPTLREVAALGESLAANLQALLASQDGADRQNDEGRLWLQQLRNAIAVSAASAAERIRRLEQLAVQCHEFAEMDFEFLHNAARDLLAIGYNVTDSRLDASCYDLLASEARLTSFLLIAQGLRGQEHWFALGRLLTSAHGAPALLSWSGSMFEYLMPLLVMPTYESTLLDQTCKAVVQRQIQYGKQRGVPWGISESGFNTFDLHLNYQYRAFGVPGLGLKRGLAEDVVISPYATALALMVAPEAACRNLERLAADGRDGAYGFYEAVDYTPSRLPPGASSITVKQVMAHHAGMSLLSLAYVLLDKPMQRRFEADPEFRAANLLLQERIPRTSVPVYPHAVEASVTREVTAEEAGTMRVFKQPGSSVPEVHLLSNGQYHLMITSAGGGYSRWRDLAVTRWREDPTRDCWGAVCYLRDVESGVLWSTTWRPALLRSKSYEAIFTQSRAEFRRQDDQIEAHTQISIAAEDDLELTQVKLTNRSDRPRTIELTSYAEVVLAAHAQDESHPAFSNLFVQSEILRARQAILCTRRPRSAEERPPWLVHMLTATGEAVGEASFETDRMTFIGRGRSLESPAAFDQRGPLSNTDGSTLDPIVSIRHTLLMQPGATVRVDIVTGVAETRESVAAMAEKYSDSSLADRVFELAWSRAPIMLRQLNATEAEAQVYGRLAGSVIFASSLRRAKASVLMRNRRGQSGLWGYGISGDLPIVLVRIRDQDNIELVQQAVQAHAYWRLKGLRVDLVIWNEDDSVYRQTLQDAILDLVAASPDAAMIDRPGGVFVRRGEQMSEEDRTLLLTVARVVLLDEAGSLLDQVNRRDRRDVPIPLIQPVKRSTDVIVAATSAPRDLEFFNGLGGFSRDGREYVIMLKPQAATPAPWVNVIANSQLGTVVSESGSAYTWAENSHEFRLTPWTNDPVSDTCGEAIYLRDEESGRFWSPSPSPARGTNTCISRHGFGYSIFDSTEDGITTELCIYVATDAPVKFARLKVSNRSGRARQLSVTGYWELVLGELRSKSLMHVVTESDAVTGAILARNPYNPDFGDRIVFVACSETERTITTDRTEFLGRNGSPSSPAALRRTRLSNRTGAGLDACAAIQTQLTLDDRQEKIVVFTLGAAGNEREARQLVQRFRGEAGAQQALEGVWHFWSQTLGVVYVETPDPAVNFMANGWMIYQTLACRMWARTGFYQSGGAYGFRDQLQDAMALVHAEPGLLRAHLLRAAGRQFREGDVQHWWHPPAGRGVRTQFSDDYLWLPVAVSRYVQMTGDTGVLDERIPFLTARALHPEEESNYDLPQVSDDIGSLYDHAVRAIDHGLRFGSHGLPLMGCGDWNDGMNLVGQQGRGESVWLGFFLYDVLQQFAKLARRKDDAATADRFEVEAGRLRGNLEEHGWDGAWYRRAYFDDGTALGSAENVECQIDSISQSWSVLSGAGPQERSLTAMQSVDRRLVRRDAKLIQLLDPPFDKSTLNPGYIKGYVPGVRENGGQYTHSAIWTVMAFAAMGHTERAWELFGMINPVSHGSTAKGIATYRVEPYVVAADVYGVAPHVGRGGWTWYTGSSGWMYRLITESLLGLQLDVDTLRFHPHPPQSWPSFKIHYRFHRTFYHITIQNGGEGKSIRRLSIDGIEQPEQFVPLVDDGVEHNVEIELE